MECLPAVLKVAISRKMMEDRKKILSHNTMQETYHFVNKTYWISVMAMLVLGAAITLETMQEEDRRRRGLLYGSGGGVILFLIVLSIARSTTALKVVTILGSAFFAGFTVGIFSAM